MFKKKFKVRVTTEIIDENLYYIVQYSNFYFNWWVTIKEFFFLTSDYGWWTNRHFSTKESALEYAKDLDMRKIKDWHNKQKLLIDIALKEKSEIMSNLQKKSETIYINRDERH